MDGFRYHCETCDARACCEYSFGKYYRDKSHGEVGCDNKIKWFDLHRVIAEEERVRAEDAAAFERFYRKYAASDALWHKYTVTHKGREYDTAARSGDEAINFIRFRLYGRTPSAQCEAFAVRLVESGFVKTDATKASPKRADILERLKNMSKGR